MSSKKLVTCEKRLEINSNKMLWRSSLYSESTPNFVKTAFTVCEFAITNSQPKKKKSWRSLLQSDQLSYANTTSVCYVELHCLNITGDWPLRAVAAADLQTWERLQKQSWGEARKRKVVWKQNCKTEDRRSLVEYQSNCLSSYFLLTQSFWTDY